MAGPHAFVMKANLSFLLSSRRIRYAHKFIPTLSSIGPRDNLSGCDDRQHERRFVHTRMCRAYIQILMLIEERENSNVVSPEKLSDAMLTMLHARMVCYEGHVMDALAIYDNIAQSLAPTIFGRR